MKKTTRKLATWKFVARLIVSVLCILTVCFIEATAVNFAAKSLAIQDAENTGNTITNTAYGPRTWTDSQIEDYNNAMAAKKELIKGNDVAKFFSDLGGSTTGRIFRWFVVLALMPMWLYVSAIFAHGAVWTIANRFKKWNKRRKVQKAQKLEKKTEKKAIPA